MTLLSLVVYYNTNPTSIAVALGVVLAVLIVVFVLCFGMYKYRKSTEISKVKNIEYVLEDRDQVIEKALEEEKKIKQAENKKSRHGKKDKA